MRQFYQLNAEICGVCLHKQFAKFTVSNLLFGWWGFISMFVTPVYILQNIYEYGSALRRVMDTRSRKENKLRSYIVKLPAHIRKGLLRLYIGVSSLWVAWFCYQIFVIVNSHHYAPVWRLISGQFWAMLLVPVGSPILFFIALWIYEGFRKPHIEIGNLRDRIATDILFRPDIAAYEYLATGSLFGKKSRRFRLNSENLSADEKAVLPSEFYESNGIDPNEMAKLFGYASGKEMTEHLILLFTKWGYLERSQLLNKVIDEELDRRMRKASAARR